MTIRIATIVSIAALALALCNPAAAQPGASSNRQRGTDKPWYRGVTPEQQRKARALFRDGARLHRQFLYAQAAAKYRQALEHWKHPDIYFNLARALIKQEKPLEAHESLRQAIQYGRDSLAANDYKLAREYRAQLESQLAKIEVRCDEPGSQITIDGEPFFAGPGKKARFLLPGTHVIVTSKKGYMDETRKIELAPGERQRVTMTLLTKSGVAIANVSCDEPSAHITLDGRRLLRCPGTTTVALTPDREHTFLTSKPGRVTTQRKVTLAPGQHMDIQLTTASGDKYIPRRWQPWKPWATVAAGAALGLTGSVLQWRASNNFRSYDQEIELCRGCVPSDTLSRKVDRGRLQLRLSIASYIAGGATLVGGLVLVYLNQPYALSTSESHAGARAGPWLSPTVAPGSIGLVAGWRH